MLCPLLNYKIGKPVTMVDRRFRLFATYDRLQKYIENKGFSTD